MRLSGQARRFHHRAGIGPGDDRPISRGLAFEVGVDPAEVVDVHLVAAGERYELIAVMR